MRGESACGLTFFLMSMVSWPSPALRTGAPAYQMNVLSSGVVQMPLCLGARLAMRTRTAETQAKIRMSPERRLELPEFGLVALGRAVGNGLALVWGHLGSGVGNGHIIGFDIVSAFPV